jgi:hypothetical protein
LWALVALLLVLAVIHVMEMLLLAVALKEMFLQQLQVVLVAGEILATLVVQQIIGAYQVGSTLEAVMVQEQVVVLVQILLEQMVEWGEMEFQAVVVVLVYPLARRQIQQAMEVQV